MKSPHATEAPRAGVEIEPVFARHGEDPLDAVAWATRTATIKDDDGKVVWTQEGVEVPEAWSQLATDVVVSKYFYGDPAKTLPGGRPERERSVRQLVDRVSYALALRGNLEGYFPDSEAAVAFQRELAALTVGQYGSFNSPVWFNVGLHERYGIKGPANNYRWDEGAGKAVSCEDALKHPQGSACFIQSVADDMGSIMDLVKSEAMLFKFGSGTGTDLSTLRSCKEKLSGGGTPSGPLSFMRVYDATAGVVKSGGKTRRAAKMQTLKDWHPDIREFARAKSIEERKAHILIDAGYDGSFNGPAYGSIAFQNANLSVRVTDAFLEAVVAGETWRTRAVTTGAVVDEFPARELMGDICDGTWLCGDPGLQYADTVARWHTVPNTAPINSSNPCSEYMHVDDSACNLASLNLAKFLRPDGTFDVERFKAAVRFFIIGQEILVGMASYPTPQIAENSHKLRPLGLGYCNLGGLLMRMGLPYDSDEGRAIAGAITAIMQGQAYLTSAELAAAMGPFAEFAKNREAMLHVVQMHADAALAALKAVAPGSDPAKSIGGRRDGATDVAALYDEGWSLLQQAVTRGAQVGFRNSQVTVLAPTGTISFMMDADTTGLEPDIALIKYKLLAGGGRLKIVNQAVEPALRALGYGIKEDRSGNGDVDRFDEVRAILDHVDETGTVEGPYEYGIALLKPEHLAVFDCAFPVRKDGRAISWEAHLKMMAAIQPFISGALSKTVNMPEGSTPADIQEAYIRGWKMGLKAVAIYRDGSKRSQPLTTSAPQATPAVAPGTAVVEEPQVAYLRKLEKFLIEHLGAAPALDDLDAALAKLAAAATPARRKLPRKRKAVNERFEIRAANGPVEGYINVGFHPDGSPGEVFITMSKQGSTVNGLMDVIGTLVSLGLQYGVPLDVLVNKFAHTRFEPNGFTDNPDIPIAKSVADYIFRWLGMEFVPGYREEHAPKREPAESHRGVTSNASMPVDDTPSSAVIAEVMAQFKPNGRPMPAIVSTPSDGPNGYASLFAATAVLGEMSPLNHMTGRECPACHATMVPKGTCEHCVECGYDGGGCG